MLSDAAVSALESALEGYAAALEADSVAPRSSYTKDGQTVSRNEWRASLIKAIKDINDELKSNDADDNAAIWTPTRVSMD